MTEIKLYKTTNKGLKIIALTIPFVVIGIWMITKEPFGTTNYIMGWLCTCFFGLGIPVGLFQTFDRRPQIIINENGIWDRTTNPYEIKWEQIIEAYPLDIFDQRFISLVTDDTFVFKKKLYNRASKINESIGAQKLNISLGQINIDENQLTNFINKIIKTKKEDRKNIIQEFKDNLKTFPKSDFKRIPLYILISIGLLLLSLTSFFAFMTIMVLMGIAALTARWHWGTNINSKLRKYAGLTAYFGFANMVLCLMTIETYDYITENVGSKISTKIENYYDKFDNYPENLEPIKKELNFNFIQRHFADKIEYKVTENDFKLQLNTLFNNDRIYNIELNEWE